MPRLSQLSAIAAEHGSYNRPLLLSSALIYSHSVCLDCGCGTCCCEVFLRSAEISEELQKSRTQYYEPSM